MEELKGGESTASVLKIGGTVHRTLNANSEKVHTVLQVLEEANVTFVPRFLGIDEHNREILTYLEGRTPDAHYDWTTDRLITVVKMLRIFHDATVGMDLLHTEEVMCHRDLAPWNTIIFDDEPIGFIDFDGVEPGKRAEDLGYMLWTFLKLGSNRISSSEQIERIFLLCSEYGYYKAEELVKCIISEQERILQYRKSVAENTEDPQIQSYSLTKVEQIQKEIIWVKENTQNIIRRFERK